MYEQFKPIKKIRPCPACSSNNPQEIAPVWFASCKDARKKAKEEYCFSNRDIVSQDKKWTQTSMVVICFDCGCVYEKYFEIKYSPVKLKPIKKIAQVDLNE